MSLTAEDRKSVWQDHRESLSRIKTQLASKTSPVPKVRTPMKDSLERKSNIHSPFGKYRPLTPPYLPRIETPPDVRRKSTQLLRGSKYEVVPALKESFKQSSSIAPKRQFAFNFRNEDYDSWGEESDEDPETPPGQYMPYPYGLPQQVVFGAPFPVYYPPPPPRKQKKRRKNENERSKERNKSPVRSDSRQPLVERYVDVNRSMPTNTSKRKPKNVTFSYPNVPMPGGFIGYPGYPSMVYPQFYGVEESSKKKDGRYKYIQPSDSPFSSSELHGEHMYNRFKDNPDRLLSYYMKDHPLFGENLVNWFVNQCLDEFIPDILIDALHELGQLPGGVENMAERVRDDVIAAELPVIMHDTVRSTLNEMVNEYMLYTTTEGDPLENFLDRLLNDAVKDATTDIVRDTVRGMARKYIEDRHFDDIFNDLFSDYVDDIAPEVVSEAKFEVVAEDFIRDEVIEPEIQELLPEISKEVLTHYDTKVMRRELKEVSNQAGQRLMDSIVLDYLLNLLARQGNVWSESDHANKYMDEMISTILLEKLFDVTVNRRKTIANKPLKKMHEKIVTDVALDVLLQQLCASLDEDLLDVDEYERDIIDQ